MSGKPRRFLITLATMFVATFLFSWAIVTILPGCFWLSLGIYLACASGSWLAITIALIAISVVIAVAVATVIHWNDRLY